MVHLIRLPAIFVMRCMMRNILAISLSAIAVCSAFGQVQREMNATVRGEGALTIDGRRQNVRQVRVYLRSNGRADITVTADRNETLAGSWYQNRGGEVDIEITSGFGSTDTSGNGRVIMSRDMRSFTEIDLAGRSRSGRWSLDFSTQRGGGDWGWDRPGRLFDLRQTERGRGTLNYQGRMDVRDLSVRLERNGRFAMELIGNRRLSLSGTWTLDNRGQAVLTIDDAFDRSQARGNGRVTLSSDQRTFTSANFNGSIGRDRFSFDFNVDRWNNGGNDRDFPGFDATQYGSRTMMLGGEGGVNVTSVRANLHSNGDITIDTRGPRNFSVSGTWRMTQTGVIEFSIHNGFGRDGARGTGRITLERGNRTFSRIDMSGTTSGRNFSLGFIAR